jgi:hypothetical protein
MALSYVATGTVASGTTTVAPGFPTGWAADDLLITLIGSRGTGAVPTAPAGWTALADAPSTTSGSEAADSGTIQGSVFYRVAVAGDTAPTYSRVSADGMIGHCVGVRRSAGTGYAVASSNGVDSTVNTTHLVTAAADPGATANDFILAMTNVNGDAIAAAITSISWTWTGITVGSVSTRATSAATGGNDSRDVILTAAPTGGPSSAAPSVTWTWGTGSTANHPVSTTIFVRVREDTAAAAPLRYVYAPQYVN